MADFRIKKGYDVPISGDAKKETSDCSPPPFVAMCPVEFPGLKPRLAVAVNDEVKVGSLLFYDKRLPEIRFLSPACGRVTAINYGPRRVIEEIVVATSDKVEYEPLDRVQGDQIAKMDRADLIEMLQKAGLWPYVRRRPFNKIANPEEQPKSIFVNCMDTSPLANDPAFSLKDQRDNFATGLQVLKVLCPKVHVCMASNGGKDVFGGHDGVSTNTFSGKHPAGLTGTHITKIDPINKGEVIWHFTARDLTMIGEFFETGKYPVRRTIAVAGPGASEPRYYRAQQGMKIKDIVGDKVADGEQRYISGSVLSGSTRQAEGYLGFYDDLITVIPEGRKQEFIGWMLPGAGKPSFTRTFLSAFLGSKRFDMNTNINGGRRAIIQSGMWEKVVALDIHPEFLTKATMAEDIDAMEQLGILECDPEDFALCTYIDPSKTEVSKIIAQGLELMEKEG